MDILTEQDTFLGRTAYRNKLITQQQLVEALTELEKNPELRLGDYLVRMGYLDRAHVDAILEIQDKQREILENRTLPAVATPPFPSDKTALPSDKSGLEASISSEGVPAVSITAQTLPQKLEHMVDYLAYTRASGASDLHICAGVSPFLRLHGRICEMAVPPLPPEETERLLFEILGKDQKMLLMKNLGLEFCLDVPNSGRYRVCLYKQRCGFDGTFRVINHHVPTFEELSLPDCLRRLTEFGQGLVLVTGPGNSGKTTTMAALLDLVNATRDDHIITIEKPVEYLHRAKRCQVTQREVGTHTRSFSHSLRAALREDPDVIAVSELRDLETLEMAIAASETGHLVIGTLHTTSAAFTVSRIVDAFPPSQQNQIRITLSESLRGIISQQLVPRKDGQGVVLALEILLNIPAVGALLRDNKAFQIHSIMQTSRKIGMCRMDDSLQQLASDGVIDGFEAYQRAVNKQAFAMYKPQ